MNVVDIDLTGADQPPLESGYVAPSSGTEHALVAMWSDLLRVERGRVGVESNFMELGGTSLLLKEMLVQLNQRMQANLLIAELFQYPTIRSLATRVAGKPETGANAGFVQTQGDRRRAALLQRRHQTNK